MTDGDGDNASVNKTRPRSRSRIRRVKNGDEKPMGSRLKKIMRGISRKSSRSVGDAASVASTSQAVSLQPEWQKTSETSSPSKTAPVTEIETLSLELVLLLLDPTTRRFELLQLEFDSLRARVVDILAQIPVSVTEDSIRNQQYEGVIVETCELMDQTARLVDFCRGKQVLVALPKGLSIKDCVRLARPILSNAKVLEMLTYGGFDVSKWKRKEGPASPLPVVESKSRDFPAVSSEPEVVLKEEVKSSVNAFPLIAGLAILAIMLQAIHIYLATPIQVGVPLPPGTKRSKCGLIGHLPPQLSFSACTNSFLEVNADGSVSILNTYRELDMLLVGGVCTKENCIEGLVMHADRSVFVGGKRVKSLLVYGKDATVTPWPFEEAPRLKVKKFTLNK